MNTFGQNLYALRKEKNITQEELATLLDVSRQTISNWENDTAQPTIDKVIKLAATYEISIDDFVGNTLAKKEAVISSPLLEAMIGKRVKIHFNSLTHAFFPANEIKHTEIMRVSGTSIEVKVYGKEKIEQTILIADIVAIEEEEQ